MNIEDVKPKEVIWFKFWEVDIVKPTSERLAISALIGVIVWLVVMELLGLIEFIKLENDFKLAYLLTSIWSAVSTAFGIVLRNGSKEVKRLYWTVFAILLTIGFICGKLFL